MLRRLYEVIWSVYVLQHTASPYHASLPMNPGIKAAPGIGQRHSKIGEAGPREEKTKWWRMKNYHILKLSDIAEKCTFRYRNFYHCIIDFMTMKFDRMQLSNYMNFCKIAHFFMDWWVNSSPPSAAYIPQWTGSVLVRVMACHLFGANPLPEPELAHCKSDPWQQNSVKIES